MTTLDELLAASAHVEDVGDAALGKGQAVLDAALRAPSKGRGVRFARSRRPRFVLAGLIAAAAFAVATTVSMPWNHGDGLAGRAYAVTARQNGAVRVETSWSKLRDPAALQAALNVAHAHTKLYVIGNAPGPTDRTCARSYVQPSTDVPLGTLTGDSGDDGHFDMTINTSRLPDHTTLVLVVDYLSPRDGQASTLYYFAVGSLPRCVPNQWNGPTGGGTLRN